MRLIIVLFTLLIAFSVKSQVILDFESSEGSTNFQYFGSSLEGELNNIISNPNSSGINTSANVADHVKAANSEVWSGAFSMPSPSRGLDATSATQLCLDVHMDHLGSCSLKLENSSTEAWINTVNNTLVNEWERLCFDLTQNSIEDANNDGTFDAPAMGKDWSTLVMFFDFQQAFDQDMTYYFDNIEFVETALLPVDIGFSVNMQDVLDVDTVYLRGTFNNFSLDDPMVNMGNSIWSLTKTLERGQYEYLFYIKSGDRFEVMDKTDACVNVFDDGVGNVFVNRKLNANMNKELDLVCFESCYDCGNSINITFRLGFDVAITPNEDGVYLAGGGNFDVPGGRFEMIDSNDDGVFEITVERELGFSSYYTFANGPCFDFSCKENLAGQDCADPNSFNDRFFNPIQSDTILETCFMECTETTSCSGFSIIKVNFSIDAREINVSSEGLFILGNFTQWSDVSLSDDDGDQIYTGSFDLPPGPYEYLYKNGSTDIEQFVDGDNCTLTTIDGPNTFINRFIEVTDDNSTVDLPTYCFNSCEPCTTSLFSSSDGNFINIYPTVVSNELIVDTDIDKLSIRVISLDGSIVMPGKLLSNGSNRLNLENLPKGVYLVHCTFGNKTFIDKIIRN